MVMRRMLMVYNKAKSMDCLPRSGLVLYSEGGRKKKTRRHITTMAYKEGDRERVPFEEMVPDSVTERKEEKRLLFIR